MILLLRYWKESALVALILAVIGMGYQWQRELVAKGAAEERSRVADSVLKVVSAQSAKAETLFTHDTIRLTKRLTEYAAVHDTILKHLIDTIAVKQFVYLSDSTVHECKEALGDCAARVGLLALERDAWRTKALAASMIPVRSCAAPSLVSAAVGLAAGFLAHR